MYTYIKNIANTSSSSKATGPKHGENSNNNKKTSVKGRNINYICTLAFTTDMKVSTTLSYR